MDQVACGALFKSHIPELKPLYVNLPDLPPDNLQTRGGFLGWILWLLKERDAPIRDFRRTLIRVVQHLEAMPDDDQYRWRILLSYIQALVYHCRKKRQVAMLKRTIHASVQTDQHRQTVAEMEKSYAEELIEEGMERGIERGRQDGEIQARQSTLLRLLQKRFGDLSPELAGKIRATGNIEKLDSWLERLLTASTLDEMGI